MQNFSFLSILLFLFVFSVEAQDGNVQKGLDPKKPINRYVVNSWTVEDGLPQNTIDALLQSSDGYLWIGTWGGLARFDGAKFVNFDKSKTSEFRHNNISAMVQDKNGALWIGTNGGGIVRYFHNTYTLFSFNEGLTNPYIRSLLIQKDGTLLAGTERGGIFRFSQEKFSPVKYPGLPENISLRTMLQDSSGTVWLATSDGLVSIIENRASIITTAQGLINNSIQSLFLEKNGAVWIGTPTGLSKYNKGTFTNYTTANGLSNNVVRSLYIDQRNNLWIGTDGGGLNRLNLNSNIVAFDHLVVEDGLISNFIRVLMEDHEGSLWIGTRAGLNRLHNGKFTALTMKNGLVDNFIRTVFQDSKGNIWIGTNGGGLDKMSGDKITHFNTDHGLSSNFIRSLCEDQNGTLWIGTDGGGICRYNPALSGKNQFTAFTKKDGLAENYVRAIIQSQDGALWIGTYGGGISKFSDGKFTNYTVKEGLNNNFVFCLYEDMNGILYIGTNGGGINKFRNGKFETITTENGLSNNFIFTLYEGHDGTLWIGTNGGGLNSIANGVVKSFTTYDGLYDDVVLSIIEDNRGYLWLGGNRGVFAVAKENIQNFLSRKVQHLTPKQFSKKDGLLGGEVSGVSQPSAWKTRDGQLWFPTLKGVAIVNPHRLIDNPEPPRIAIEEIIADGELISSSSLQTLPAGTRSVEFHYTAFSFIAPEKMRFKYKLDGFDDQWIDAGNRRVAYYTNLPPGEFVFKVLASNNDGVWNEKGASLAIEKQPFFYQTIWFYVLLLCVAGALSFAVYRLRLQALHEHHRQLEKVIEDRTHNLAEANRHKTELLNIVAHDVRNPLNTIQLFAESTKEHMQQNEDLKYAHSMITWATTHLLSFVTELLNFSSIESGKLKIEKNDVDVAPLLEYMVRLFRLRASQKSQQILFEQIGDGPFTANIDTQRTQDIFDNLLSNAVKFSQQGKRIFVRVMHTASAIRIEVQDEGPGFTTDDKPLLFQEFRRLSARPTAGEPSTGLGLSIAKSMVEMMGGKIWCESVAGNGATFIVELPI